MRTTGTHQVLRDKESDGNLLFVLNTNSFNSCFVQKVISLTTVVVATIKTCRNTD
jgi:hypothetical protein